MVSGGATGGSRTSGAGCGVSTAVNAMAPPMNRPTPSKLDVGWCSETGGSGPPLISCGARNVYGWMDAAV